MGTEIKDPPDDNVKMKRLLPLCYLRGWRSGKRPIVHVIVAGRVGYVCDCVGNVCDCVGCVCDCVGNVCDCVGYVCDCVGCVCDFVGCVCDCVGCVCDCGLSGTLSSHFQQSALLREFESPRIS